jgi:hypothetical protein
MVWLLAIVTVILTLVFLSAARFAFRPLPAPVSEVPEYTLWLVEERDVPALDPAPAEVVIGRDAPSTEGVILALGPEVSVASDLPRRLAACGSDFVSVMPVPVGGVLSVSAERTLRDLVNGPRVNDPEDAAAYGDERCAWFPGSTLRLPSVGGPTILAAARARKLHGLPIDLRDGANESSSMPIVSTRGDQDGGRRLIDAMSADPAARWFAASFLLICNVIPVVGLYFEETRTLAYLTIGIVLSTRLMTALRERLGWSLVILGWFTELWWAFSLLKRRTSTSVAAMPSIPDSAPPRLTGSEATGASVLDQSAVLYLARRLGGSGVVMDQLYDCQPTGTTAFGRLIDRWVHWAAATRAVRWRWLVAGELIRRTHARHVLSVPCGTARDIRWAQPESAVLVDPDPAAREAAARFCPDAHIAAGSIDDLPTDRFECIVYLGLSEYLGDGEVRRHLEVLRSHLTDNGALITSITAEHGQRDFMARHLGWSTRARTTDGICELLEAAGFRVELMEHDPHRIQWVLLARPKQSLA